MKRIKSFGRPWAYGSRSDQQRARESVNAKHAKRIWFSVGRLRVQILLEFERLIQSGHLNMRIGKPSGEAGHDVFFAVNEESMFWPGLLMPGEQFRLIRMR